jgi:serine/threonine protein kinase
MQVRSVKRIASFDNGTSSLGSVVPNQTTANCPDPQVLSDYVLGKLDPRSSGECENHLAQCEPCIETINGLNINDTFHELVAQPENVQSLPLDQQNADPGVVNNLIHRMVDFHPAASGGNRLNQSGANVADVIELLEPAESDDELGRIEHYRIERVLGAGSTGGVFYAVDENLNRPVAIKVLRPSLGDAARERFVAEARATAKLIDANVVTIFHVGVAQRLAYIVMQWLPGETLEQRLQRERQLSWEQVSTLGRQVASGLAAAHQQGLVHRDIKPANLWITESTEIKILDFGLVRIMDEDPRLTCTGMIAGTPCYMSPEQSRGDKLDARSDLFSLGCVLYQCLTGRLPFASPNALATLQSIQRDLPVTPRTLDPSIDEDASDLIMTLLEKSPHRRPDSAQQLLKAFEDPRADWQFTAARYSDHQDAVQPSAANVGGKASPATRSRSTFFWPLAGLMLAMFGWGGYVFGPQVIQVMTDQGEIVINTNDPDVQVEILNDGQRVEIVDLKTKQKLQIKSGDYQIKPVGDSNSISIDKSSLTLRRGEKAIVTVTKKPAAEKGQTSSAVPTPPSRNSPEQDSYAVVDLNHLIGPGDVLNIFVDSVFGWQGGQPIFSDQTRKTGAPVHVKSDGTIALPSVKPFNVQGKTALEVENLIRQQYEGGEYPILKPGQAMIGVTVDRVYQLPDDAKVAELKSQREMLDQRLSYLLARGINPGHLSVVKIRQAIESIDLQLTDAVLALATHSKPLTEPVYDGRTFAQCLNSVLYEREQQKLELSIGGLMKLGDAEQDGDRVIPAVTAALKKVSTSAPLGWSFYGWCTDQQRKQVFMEFATEPGKFGLVLLSNARFAQRNQNQLGEFETDFVAALVQHYETGSPLVRRQVADVFQAMGRSRDSWSKTTAKHGLKVLMVEQDVDDIGISPKLRMVRSIVEFAPGEPEVAALIIKLLDGKDDRMDSSNERTLTETFERLDEKNQQLILPAIAKAVTRGDAKNYLHKYYELYLQNLSKENAAPIVEYVRKRQREGSRPAKRICDAWDKRDAEGKSEVYDASDPG